MEKRKVRVILRGTQHDISNETIEQNHHGYYYYRNNTHYISYTEIDEAGEQSSPSGTSLLKIKDSSVYLLKKGAITTRMEYDTEKNHFTPYQTPYGTFQMEIATNQLTVRREGEDIHLDINYQLKMDGKPLSRCSIEIQVLF